MCALYKGKQIWIFVGGGWQAGVFMSLPTPNAWMNPSTHGRAVSCAGTRALAATSKDSAYKNVLFVLFRLIRKNERWQTKPETILLLLSTVVLCPALMKRIAQTHARTTRARARSDAHTHTNTRVCHHQYIPEITEIMWIYPDENRDNTSIHTKRRRCSCIGLTRSTTNWAAH